jgi:uroporphyrinogen-III synthase
MRLEIPEDMKYFCVTEQIALYIQKYVQYRKRKVFFGNTGKIVDLLPQMVKHKNEKYLIPMSDVHDNSTAELLNTKKLNHTECVMYRTVSNDFTEEEIKSFDYDMCVFFSPSGINAFEKTFGKTKNDEVVVATFGPSTTKSAHEAGLNVVIEAPQPEFPSMTAALKSYLSKIS